MHYIFYQHLTKLQHRFCVLNLILSFRGRPYCNITVSVICRTPDDDNKDNSYSDRAIRHLDGKEYRGRPLVVEESRARPPNSTKVFVGNLSATCSADDLHGLFSTFGRVLDCDKVKGELESHKLTSHHDATDISVRY